MAIVALAASGSLQVYYLVDHVGTRLYWKIGSVLVRRLGPHRLPFQLVGGIHWLRSANTSTRLFQPSDVRAIGTVLRVVPSGVVRYVVEYGEHAAKGADLLTPFDDGFYDMCSGGLCKWTDKGFEPATEEEQRRLDRTIVCFEADSMVRTSTDSRCVKSVVLRAITLKFRWATSL